MFNCEHNYQIMVCEKLNVHRSQQHLRTDLNEIRRHLLFPVNCKYDPEKISHPGPYTEKYCLCQTNSLDQPTFAMANTTILKQEFTKYTSY